MGWLWSSSGESAASTDKLDPSLRDFLDTETRSGPAPALPAKPKAAPTPVESAPATQQDSASDAPATPLVPPQSQFQDGRYAHLWKNYTPQQDLVNRSKTEQDKLRDIVDAYNDRRADIGRTAMENCALEYIEQFNCFKNPGFKQAMTLCRDESRKFNKCYDMQSKFLKALGFLTMDARSKEDDDKIQMHADQLYQQMVKQEALINKAIEEGTPIPRFESVLSKRNVANAMSGESMSIKPLAGEEKMERDDESDVWSNIKPESRQQYEKALAEISPEDREIERSALLGELRAQTYMAKKVEGTFVEERIARLKRRENGQTTIGDTIKRLWGWDSKE